MSISLAHRIDGEVIGVSPVALPHRARRLDRGFLADAQELARQRLAGHLPRPLLLHGRHFVFPA